MIIVPVYNRPYSGCEEFLDHLRKLVYGDPLIVVVQKKITKTILKNAGRVRPPVLIFKCDLKAAKLLKLKETYFKPSDKLLVAYTTTPDMLCYNQLLRSGNDSLSYNQFKRQCNKIKKEILELYEVNNLPRCELNYGVDLTRIANKLLNHIELLQSK